MNEVLCISGGAKLSGQVRVSGAKNAALPLIIATVLSGERSELYNVPDLEDISALLRLMRSLGAQAEFSSNTVSIETPNIRGTEAPYGAVKALRASFWVLGPLLARAGTARVALPGGDAIGTRPVDLHLQGLAKLGADIRMKHGVVEAHAPGGLRGALLELAYPSVGATHHLMLTAVLSRGETIIQGAAQEPEVTALAEFLSLMGAQIEGAGTKTIKIQGKRELGGACFEVLGDRIEAATYLLSGIVTGGSVRVEGVLPDALCSMLDVLEEAGAEVTREKDAIIAKSEGRLKAVSFDTSPYPGVATDVQPLLMSALTRALGVSTIRETVFENRFGHVAEYRRFGADIDIDGRFARITGVPNLSAAPVEATDIRAAAGEVLMGLMAKGVTQIREVYHLDRGYENLVEKLCGLGAQTSRIPSFEAKEVILGC